MLTLQQLKDMQEGIFATGETTDDDSGVYFLSDRLREWIILPPAIEEKK